MRAVDSRRWAQLSALLDELLDLEGSAREARLAQLARDDSALGAELAALLAQQGDIEREHFLEGSALARPDPTLAGQTVGAYTLERPLGAGGMGSVWLARRSDGRFEGRVAVKLLNLALLARGGAERFAREGDVLARLAHPHIARLLDAGVTAGGQPYLVLEHVEGQAIDSWCEAHAPSIEARVRLLLDVLGAVAHAHSKLVLHRDLKPGNILVTHEGQVKLLDFGIAKLLDDEATPVPATELTQLAGRAFTPDYAAPEQVEGGDVTTATDVYALGVLMYMLLGGVHPTMRARHTPVERLRSVVETEPPRLSEAAARTDAGPRAGEPLARALRGDLDNIVAKALKKAPGERYPTAAAFADDLRRYLADEPVAARPDSLRYRTAKFVRRHRLAVGAASVTLLALVGGIVGTTWQAIEARRERDQALYQTKRAEFQASFSYRIMSEVGADGQPITIRQLMEKGIDVLEHHYGEDPRFVIGMLVNISGRYMDVGDTQGEYAALVKAAAIADKLGDPEQIAFVQCNTVETELATGRLEQAAQRMRIGLDNLKRMRHPPMERETDCGTAQARLLWSQGRLDEAIGTATEVATALERGRQTEDLAYMTVTSMLQVMLSQAGRLNEAMQWNRRNEAAQLRAGRGGTLSMSLNQANRAAQLYDGGDIRAAWELQRAIVDRLVTQQGVSSVRATIAHRFGLSQVRIEETAAGLTWIDRGISMAAAKNNRPAQVGALISRAQARLMLGRLEEASADLDAAERLAQMNPGEHRSALRTSRLLRAQWRMAKGDAATALDDIDRLLAETDNPRNRLAPHLARSMMLKAQAHLALGAPGLALTEAQEAVAAAQAIALDPRRSADVGAALMVLAHAQRASGDVEGARTSAQRATEVLTSSLGPGHSQTIAAVNFN
jgi:serine/threonine protein kinase/tetratricopeptide (TPR) repeat protein